jgi:hypothetical protein
VRVLDRLRAWLRSRHRAAPTGPDTPALQETFSAIYADETWSDRLPGMPRSGRGALPTHARSVIEFITARIESGDVRSIVDIGCGDLTWVSTIPQVTSGQIGYIGYDVVPELIDQHRALGWGEFRFADLTAPGFRVQADLVLVKDVLFHLRDEQVERALANLRASEWRWLLTSSSPNASNANRQFDRWHFAPLNLLVAPYDLRPTLHLDRPAGGWFVVFEPSGFDPQR